MTTPTPGTERPLLYEAAAAPNAGGTGTMWKQGLATSERTAPVASQREHRKEQLVAGIKQAIAGMVLATGGATRTKNSDYLSSKLRHDYTYLANLFSETTGSTVEQYIIEFKINRVKDLLAAGELNLTQISHRLNYSSVAHLSNQFKKVTGLTPSSFKRLQSEHGIVPKSVNDATVFCNRVNALEMKRVSFAT